MVPQQEKPSATLALSRKLGEGPQAAAIAEATSIPQ